MPPSSRISRTRFIGDARGRGMLSSDPPGLSADRGDCPVNAWKLASVLAVVFVLFWLDVFLVGPRGQNG